MFFYEHQFLRFFLPAYTILFIILGLFLKAILFRKKYKIDPLVERKGGKLQKTIVFFKRIILITGLLTISLYSVFPQYYWVVFPFEYMETELIKTIGLTLLFIAIFLVRLSQDNLGKSWRIGIDKVNKFELVTTGIYNKSRNPIALGMVLMLIGIFLIIPNAVTFGCLWSGLVITNVRICLEEEYLQNTFGKDYEEYCKKTKKWL